MKQLLYYQPDYKRFHSICTTLFKKSIAIKYEKPHISSVNVISFTSVDFPFKGVPGELSIFLENYQYDLSSLIVILGDLSPTLSGDMETELYTLFILYPEVNFFFEKKGVIPKPIIDEVVQNLVIPQTENGDMNHLNIEALLLADNLFDASNLRASTKAQKQRSLKIINNFKLWKHREKSLALVIDEERDQCLHNCYLLYANGFRSLPISSFSQVKALCSKRNTTISYDLILRDFDLQFPDEIPETYWVINEQGNSTPISTIDFVRGFKWDKESNIWIDLTRSRLHITYRISGLPFIEEEEKKNWLKEEDYQIWNSEDFTCGKIRIITQGFNNISVDSNKNSFELINANKELLAPGLKKPIEGVYWDMQKLDVIHKAFRESHNDNDAPYRERKENNHSTPLGLYEIAFALTERAKQYYDNNLYLLAAVLSQEAIEILNGFHMILTMRAFHLHAVSENAIAMSVLGGNELDLAKDSMLRVRLIKEDVLRLVKGTEICAQNVLNQIFSDCRLFCKEKEHFASEEVFISEMSYLNDGGSISKWVKDLQEWTRKKLSPYGKRNK